VNDVVLAEPQRNLLEELLAEHFSSRASFSALLGSDAASLAPELWSRALEAPVGEFVSRPGKALRAELMARSYELAGGSGACPERAQAIVEILHAGSLIVDDIEDESASRRGRPALHRLHGLPVALNAGNWMYFWALGMVESLGLDRDRELLAHQLAHRTLICCHQGQALDLTANVYELGQHQVPAVVLASAQLKTGSLTGLAAGLGALLAQASNDSIEEFTRFGRDVGVALQMLDDISGLLSEKRCHKGHEDLALGRPTWPWAWLASELASDSFSELQAVGKCVARRDTHPELLARTLRSKLRGSSRVRLRRFIHQVFARIERQSPNKLALTALRAHLQRMERSYA
jgi:geranylgeranyl pyrophosphate synthase